MRKQAIIAMTLVLSLVPQLAWAAAALKVGDKGWKVRNVQQKLTVVGQKTPITGKYTKALAAVVRKYQAKHKLKATGAVDDRTYESIINEAFKYEGIKGVKVNKLLATAAKFKGVPYSFGGTTPRAFDCSGYVQYVFNAHHVALPRLADAQALKGIYVSKKKLREGDLVFFSTYEPGASHVGIYAGNNRFWHASSSRGVMLSGLNDEYWRQRYYGARRILAQ